VESGLRFVISLPSEQFQEKRERFSHENCVKTKS